tara:strand:+ start:5172 stop:5426 length:255 start_codon:yes stop_codon:yes gene_type:complete
MSKFIHSIANKYERYVFSSTNHNLVKVVGYSANPKSKLKPAVSYLPIDLARDYYRRLMACGMSFKPVIPKLSKADIYSLKINKR